MESGQFKSVSLEQFTSIVGFIMGKIFSVVNAVILPLGAAACIGGAVLLIIGGLSGSKDFTKHGIRAIACAIFGVIFFYFIPAMMSGIGSLKPLIDQ